MSHRIGLNMASPINLYKFMLPVRSVDGALTFQCVISIGSRFDSELSSRKSELFPRSLFVASLFRRYEQLYFSLS